MLSYESNGRPQAAAGDVCGRRTDKRSAGWMKDLLKTAARGAVIGGTMLIPGVSGGSMAMMMGIYDKLILAVSH